MEPADGSPAEGTRIDADVVEIRASTTDDTAAIERLIIEMQEFERRIDPRLLPGDEMASPYRRDMEERCRAQDGTVLVAVRAGEILGFVAVQARVPSVELDQAPGDYALISDLAVDSRWRSRGIGRRLIGAAEAFARNRGATELRIAVLAGNEPASHVYSSMGYEPYLHVLTKPLAPTTSR